MTPSPFQRFFGELKRRKVFRAAGAYLVMGWVAIEVAETVAPLLGLPEWVPRLVLFLIILGFPIAVGLAWAVDITDEGVRRTEEQTESAANPAADSTADPTVRPEDEGAPGRAPGGTRAAARALVVVGLVGAALAGGWYLLGMGGGAGEEVERSIAVLPFETLGADEPSAFTEGVHSGILTRLASVSDLDVISRTSVMGYRSEQIPLRDIAARLGVEWAVRGEVQEEGGHVLVNARLLNAREDRQVWAQAYNRELTADNVFRIQSEIATAILSELHARLTVGEEQRVDRTPTSSLDAYRMYVQGRSYLDSRTEDGMRRSLDFFRRAVARDSSYALAWVGLADALTLLHDYGYEPAEATLPRADMAIVRALDLDPLSAEAHASRGLLAGSNKQARLSIRELRRAVELRPSYAEAHNWLAWGSLMIGDEDQALRSALRAVELDPLAPEAVGNLVLAYLAQGRYADALDESRRVRELEPELPEGPFYTALALYELGRADEAKSLLRDVTVPWAGSGPALTLALAHVATGDTAAARTMRDGFEAVDDPFAAGVVNAALGDVGAAFAAFDRVDAWNEYWPTIAGYHLYREVLGPLRADPRYAEVRRRLEEAWGLGSADP